MIGELSYERNMLDGSMFGTLQKNTDKQFYEYGKGAFSIYAPTGAYQYKIFAAQVANANDEAYTVVQERQDVRHRRETGKPGQYGHIEHLHRYR